MINGREFAEKFYSESVQEEEERLYSTGNDELDELLERAFCEGYEYAQKEFAEKEEKKEKKHTGAKVAAIGGGTAVAGAGGIYGADKLGKVLAKKGSEMEDTVKKTVGKDGVVDYRTKSGKFASKEQKRVAEQGASMKKAGEVMQKPMNFVRKTAKQVIKKRTK